MWLLSEFKESAVIVSDCLTGVCWVAYLVNWFSIFDITAVIYSKASSWPNNLLKGFGNARLC